MAHDGSGSAACATVVFIISHIDCPTPNEDLANKRPAAYWTLVQYLVFRGNGAKSGFGSQISASDGEQPCHFRLCLCQVFAADWLTFETPHSHSRAA
jgi:hypothetical protein